MRVTVCQLSQDRNAFLHDWEALTTHLRLEHSELLLLPEMIFSRWLAAEKPANFSTWETAVREHQDWIARLGELGGITVIGTAPVIRDHNRLNEGFIWESAIYRAAHHKYYLPDEDGFWEASWYARGDKSFNPVQTSRACVGFLICSELWFFEHARAYGRQGAQLLVTPRATESASVGKWLLGGQSAAIVSGAFSLSSNWVNEAGQFGGQGWIIDPEGDVLGITTRDQPFLSLDIDLGAADRAKQTYPRYIPE